MKVKKVISSILVLLCMATIFVFSHQTAKKSQSLSDSVAFKVLEVKAEVMKQEVDEVTKENFAQKTRVFIRKSAHFLIYLVLGILFFFVFRSYGSKRPFLYALLCCFLYACTDEIHQLFVERRTASVIDVLIDTCGAAVGLGIVYLMTKKKYLKES